MELSSFPPADREPDPPPPASVPASLAMARPPKRKAVSGDDSSDGWTSVKRAKSAARLLTNTTDREAWLAFWHGLDEPTRETMLTWFAEWDREQRRWEP